MPAAMIAVGGILSVISLVLWILILIDAFQSAIWKGIVSLLCGLYTLYYAFFEFDHEKKWPIVLGWILTSIAGSVLINIGAAQLGLMTQTSP